jgi:hypothetical protein
MIFSDLPSPAEALPIRQKIKSGFAKAGNRFTLFGIMLLPHRQPHAGPQRGDDERRRAKPRCRRHQQQRRADRLRPMRLADGVPVMVVAVMMMVVMTAVMVMRMVVRHCSAEML